MPPIPTTAKDIRKFGLLFTVLFVLIAAFAFYKDSGLWRWFLGGGAFFLITGLFAHPLLKPLYIGWMTFAYALGWFNTRLIMGLGFYLIFAPLGLFFRLIGKPMLSLKIDKVASTYWIRREAHTMEKKRYEQLF